MIMLETVKRLKRGEKAVVVCAGDSITQQNYHTNGFLNYAGLLAEKIPHACIINAGVSGDTTEGFIKRFEEDVERFKPALVTVMFGINDATKGEKYLSKFENNLYVITKSIKEIGSEILVLTQNPIMLNVNDESINTRASYVGYSKCIRDFAKQNKIPFCDVFLSWQKHVKANPYKALGLMNDPIHPNERGHKFIAETLLDYLGIK